MSNEKVSSVESVAQIIGVHPRTARGWLKQGCPGKVGGSYDIEAIKKWRAENLGPVPGTNKDPGKAELELRLLAADVAKREAEAAIKQHEKLKKTEDVVHINDVELYLTSLFTEGRRKLMKIPEVLPMGFPEDLRPAIKEECEKQLEIWLRWMANKAATVSEIKEL